MKKQIQPVSRGFSLVELMVSVAIIASLVAIMIPSVRSVRKSYESTGAKSMINSALASARAIAIKERKYAGIRFQLEHDPLNKKKMIDRQQYMVFIVHNPIRQGNIPAISFKAVEGIKPIKLPNEIMILDLNLRTQAEDSDKQQAINANGDIDEDKELLDAASFSIIFSPTGQLTTYSLRVRNRDGRTDGTQVSSEGFDQIFNCEAKTNAKPSYGMFLQDDYANYGLGEEKSKGMFWEVSRERLKPWYEKGKAWSEYLDPGLKIVEPSYINAYTGEVIKK